MDLVDWDEDRVPRDRGRLRRAGGAPRRAARARHPHLGAARRQRRGPRRRRRGTTGRRCSSTSSRSTWPSDRGAGPLRLPVQWVIRPEDGGRGERRYAGQIAGGTLREGDEVVVLPARLAHAGHGDRAARPPAGERHAARLRRGGDRRRPRRGPRRPDHGRRGPAAGRAARSRRRCAGWRPTPLRAADRFTLKHTTRTMRATVDSIVHLLDVTTLERVDPPEQLSLNDIARVVLRTSAPLHADPYETTAPPAPSSSSTTTRTTRSPPASCATSARARRTPTAART